MKPVWLARADVLLGTLVSLILITGSWQKWLPLGMTEVIGFVSGGLTVYLTIQRNIWLWPTGLVNNVFFGILFWESKLYADMGLQVVYFILSVLGWYWWLHGGRDKAELPIQRTPLWLWAVLIALTGFGTALMRWYLQGVGGSAPLWDGFTTVLCLVAQFLLTRKYIENWAFWLVADIVYVPLYISKGLYLTAALYAIFLGMCVAGWLQWRRGLWEQDHPLGAPSPHPEAPPVPPIAAPEGHSA